MAGTVLTICEMVTAPVASNRFLTHRDHVRANGRNAANAGAGDDDLFECCIRQPAAALARGTGSSPGLNASSRRELRHCGGHEHDPETQLLHVDIPL